MKQKDEVVEIYVPVKDANDMVQGFELKKVLKASLKNKQKVKGYADSFTPKIVD